MPIRFCRPALLLLLVLLPLLAHADPSGALAAAAVMELVMVLVALLASALSVWSLLQPNQPSLYAAQLAFFGLSVLLGLLSFQSSTDWPLFGRLDPLWHFAIPLGSWRTGLGVAQRTGSRVAWLSGLGVAYLALHYLLLLGLGLLLHNYLLLIFDFVALTEPRYLLGFAATAAAAWWLLSRQQPLVPWGRPTKNWWQLPAAVAAVGLGCYAGYWALFSALGDTRHGTPAWDYLFARAAGGALVNWAVGAALLRGRLLRQE